MECEAMGGIPFASDRQEHLQVYLCPRRKRNAASNQKIHQPGRYAAPMYAK
jgi:hypothetical protein